MGPGWSAACVAVAALRSPQVMQTLEEAFESGTLVRKSGGALCGRTTCWPGCLPLNST